MNRRDALRRSLAVAMFGATAAPVAGKTQPLPDITLATHDPEAYWRRIRDEQFFLPDWRTFLNNGALGVIPRPVFDAMAQYLERAAGLLVEGYNHPRWGYENLDEERTELAEFLGCKKDELAITHNATEGLSYIAAGLDLQAGDEVLMTDREHPSGKAGWQRRAQRDGIVIREVQIPHPPKSSVQLTDLMISAIGPRTKVLFFSGIIGGTGLIMPMKEICHAARAKGVIAAVDGAHVNGQIPLNLSEIGCDYFVGSPHKWMLAPAGSGLLYIREENLDRLWPTIVTGDWDNKALKAARFMRIGTNNRAIVVGMIAGLRFLKAIGPERVYARIHELAKLNYKMACSRPYVEVVSPEDDRFYGGLLFIRINLSDAQLTKANQLLTQKRVWLMAGKHARVSTHIHTRPKDLEIFYDSLDTGFGYKTG